MLPACHGDIHLGAHAAQHHPLQTHLASVTSRRLEDSWEQITEAGVTYWYNSLTSRYSAENPYADEDDSAAQEPLGMPQSSQDDAFAFLDNWAKYSDPEKLPALPPSSNDWFAEAPEYSIDRHT
mmetsp:Transcript_6566/g.25366  ORF Transcript_6566/g.25366 Transcript_6566/m.25366 type:complete len:124 (-) Transcript_6566:301-672(-)